MKMHTLFVEKLTNIDFTYFDCERGLVGETLLVDLYLSGPLDQQSMILDFGSVKQQLKHLVEAVADHKLLVPVHSKHVSLERSESLLLKMQDTQGRRYEHESPYQAVLLAEMDSITPENLENMLSRSLTSSLPSEEFTVSLNLYPENTAAPFYHYSHGLKKHQGPCQRIAHGHRSQISIKVDNQRRPDLEIQHCERWRDIYLGSEEDIHRTFSEAGCKYIEFHYQSQEGFYRLVLPEERVYRLKSDSTVERIAEHLAQTLKQAFPNDSIWVKAFEGTQKGAIVTMD